MNASAMSGLCPFLFAEARMRADQYEMVFSLAVAGRSSPVGRIGAAAPIALTGAMKMCCVAMAIIARADPAFVLMNVYVGTFAWLRTFTISAAVSSRPPYVFISKMIAEASLFSAVFTARRKKCQERR